jgi:hypothetical protein
VDQASEVIFAGAAFPGNQERSGRCGYFLGEFEETR